jgi:CRISPR/Cas system-associated exonuclease Cas4 (RecB family)
MIQKLRTHTLQALNRISPSQYYSALSCPYKLVLANSFSFKPLLPTNANAYFESIIHKMIELISNGTITDEQSFSENWRNLINWKENELKDKGLLNIVPLKYFVTDFALKKNQLRNILQGKEDKIDRRSKNAINRYHSEKRLSNPDNTITGIADLVVTNEDSVTIIDFKTGKIYTEAIDEYGAIERIVKKEYEFQLKLYAQLYFLMYGIYPVSLFLVTLENNFVEIPFTKSECEDTYQQAVSFLSTTNNLIKTGQIELLAKPAEENCKYCLYRPACNYYSTWIENNFQLVNDLTGILRSVLLFNNGSLGLQLEVNHTEILINGLQGTFKNDFEKLLNKKVKLYNVRKNKQSLNATANNFTIIYD